MMGLIWVVLFVALTGTHCGYGLPVKPTPETYPHDPNTLHENYGSGLYAAVPAMALVLTAVGLLFGCTWCYRHKGCKLFAASATHLHDNRRANPPDSGFSEPANNNISEDNNNGPISLREMQNIANNNAAAYITSENEERNRISRESIVEFEPLPSGIGVVDPLEHCADWFGGEDLVRDRLQYLREIGRGWFGRVVEGEIESDGTTSTVAVKILNQNASLEDKARFLDESRVYRDVSHENVLGFIAKCLQEDPWILIFELCSVDLQQYLIVNRPKMAILNESGVPLRLMCDVTAGLAHLHSQGILYGNVWSGAVLIRGSTENARGVLGQYTNAEAPRECIAPETLRHGAVHTDSSEVYGLGGVIWEVCAWGAPAPHWPPPPPDLPCPYRTHLYQVMQLCWSTPEIRPPAERVRALLSLLSRAHAAPAASDFEERWLNLKPNTIPKVDEHIAIVHAPSTSIASDFTSEQDMEPRDTLSVDMDTAVSRSSSIMSDKDPLSVQIKSESLTNLHGSLDDVRNIYLTHNEMAVRDCHQGNISLEDTRDKDNDRSDSSVDPWLKDIIAGSQDDVSYYRDVSDVIKNLDNILNSEKTSSSESSHQASPSRDNLSLDCKKDYPVQTSMVKSPGICNFQNILDAGFDSKDENEPGDDEDGDKDTIGTLSHSFERHSDTISQHTLENLTPDTPVKDLDVVSKIDSQEASADLQEQVFDTLNELPKVIAVASGDSEVPKLVELCEASMSSVSENIEQLNVRKDCQTSCDNKVAEVRTDIKDETKSIDDVRKPNDDSTILEGFVNVEQQSEPLFVEREILPESIHKNVVISERDVSTNSTELDTQIDHLLEEEISIGPIINQHIVSIERETVPSQPLDLNETSFAISHSKISPEHEQVKPEQDVPLYEQIEHNAITEQTLSQSPDIVQTTYEADIPEKPYNDVGDFAVSANNILKSEGYLPVLPPDIVQIKQDDTCMPTQDDKLEEVNILSQPEEVANDYSSIESKIEEIISKTEKDLPEAVTTSNVGEDKIVELICNDNSEPTPIEKIPEIRVQRINESFDTVAQNSESVVNSSEDAVTSNDSTNDIDRNVHTIIGYCSDQVACIIDEVNDVQVDDPLMASTIHDPRNTSETVKENADIIKAFIQAEASHHYDNLRQNEVNITKNDSEATNLEEEINQESVTEAVRKDIKVTSYVSPGVNNFNIDTSVSDVGNKEIIIANELGKQEDSEVEIKSDESNEEVILEDITLRSEDNLEMKQSNDTTESTVYMDLINDTNSEILNLSNTIIPMENGNTMVSCLEPSEKENSLTKNESTVYLDLPNSMTIIQDSGDFLQMEISANNNNSTEIVCSTPKASDGSNVDDTLEKSARDNETQLLSETKVPDEGKEDTLTKVEAKHVHENLSPFDSPTKSHHTDTYDENSSVVLGSFEHCSLELYKVNKHCPDLVDLPKEELLAFSSNFSEMNLETPSPLRDGNFLNEVPDIAHDDLHFDDIVTVSESKRSEPSDNASDNTENHSTTEKHISPSTPPNSPGVFLASTSQEKYLVDIDMNQPVQCVPESDNLLQEEIDLNQIELQITSKLAMAENENNLNIEYSGPLTVEGLVEDNVLEGESDEVPESYLAGNGGSVEDIRECLILDEECVKALRNELESKLPLAQVATIEPECEAEWSGELPPPPELVVSYPAALSPIAEETRQQLSAYENDANWNPSTRTDSSESYPEPCNNSTDEVTDLPTAAHSAREHSSFNTHSPNTHSPHTHSPHTHSPHTHSPNTHSPHTHSPGTHSPPTHSPNNTYTVQKDFVSSKELTMSADSLNASPYKKPRLDNESPIDDRTYNKNDEEKEACERISQVSPFLLSPTTDTSAPDNSDNFDNATGVSTLSKTTLPTDAKHSKPSETQCLSKATSIDSWCSNDTLYNVEENFDDIAMDQDGLTDFEPHDDKEDASESTDTLTHHEDEKELSHCSTYIVHDSKSEFCETFSPDSITANDNYTYTKVKTEVADATTPSAVTKSDLNDSTKNSQTKDLAYGTLMSGVPSFSNCTTEVASAVDDIWKLQQPELIRKSPIPDEVNVTLTKLSESKESLENTSPHLISEPCVKKMDSVEMSFLQDNSVENNAFPNEAADELLLVVTSPENNYIKNMAPSVTSTPLTNIATDVDAVEAISLNLPTNKTDTTHDVTVLNFLSFQQSAEVRPQDLSSTSTSGVNKESQGSEVLLEGDTKLLSSISNRDATIALESTPNYSDFENSACTKPQEKSSQSVESGSSEEFRQFQSSVRERPQDLSSVIDASSMLLKSERLSSEMAMAGGSFNDHTNIDFSPPNISNLIESHVANNRSPADLFMINFDEEEETEQPHSIIITESTMDAFKESPNKTYDSHVGGGLIDLNLTYDPHAGSAPKTSQSLGSKTDICNTVNGAVTPDILLQVNTSKATSLESNTDLTEIPENLETNESKPVVQKETPNGTLDEKIEAKAECNGGSEKFATVNFLSETFEELIESNVDDNDVKEFTDISKAIDEERTDVKSTSENTLETPKAESLAEIIPEVGNTLSTNGISEPEIEKVTVVTQDFLQNEQKYCQLDSYIPLLSDIRFTGPATEIMSTSFSQESPTEPTSPECEQDSKPNTAGDLLKEWDSDSESHSSNSSSGEFIWKQRGTGAPSGGSGDPGSNGAAVQEGGGSEASGSSGSGSEGDEVEFVPSSWDCRAAPSKSSLRSLEAQPIQDSKKRVVFKRQKYHCVYEYPREVSDVDTHSPYLPDLSTYSEWDPTSAEEAELGYGQLFGGPSPLDLYPLRAGIAFGADYDEDFFISSSARPFESLGIMSTSSQFFPGMHVKRCSLLDRELPDDAPDDFPPPPSPLPSTTLVTRTPSLDFTTPDSGVEDITPGSTTDDDFKGKKLPEAELSWRAVDSASSSESVSPSSPGGEALGGLRHTRDKLKLDLPPSPHVPSPRHNRVFNFVLDKPKRRSTDEKPIATGTTPLVMTDETPIVGTSLPLLKDCDDLPAPEPTFSTFGKSVQKVEPEQKIVLTDDVEDEAKVESPKVVEPVKGEGTVLDSGDEDSGIESSSKATLERNKTPNVS